MPWEFEDGTEKPSAFYAFGRKKAPYTDLGPMIRKMRDRYAPPGSCGQRCPYQVQEGHTTADSIALIRERLDFFTPEDKLAMLRKTAEKVSSRKLREGRKQGPAAV